MTDLFSHKFVELIPKSLEERVLYVSMEHAIAVHLCACGCNKKVVTPLAPIHWQLMFDGRAVSLTPSIGNHAFPCKSHYFIEEGRVRWSYAMSPMEIELMRNHDQRARQRFYGEADRPPAEPASAAAPKAPEPGPAQASDHRPWWRRLLG